MGGRRGGKFRRLVDDFQQTLDELGGSMPTETVEQLLRERITEVASMLGISETTVLRSHFDEDWGADMARRAWAELLDQDAQQAQTPPQWVPVDLAARLIAALGQAQMFAAVNTSPAPAARTARETAEWSQGAGPGGSPPGDVLAALDRPSARSRGLPAYDPVTAAQATTGLGLALHAPTAADPLDAPDVWVDGEVLARTRDSLAAFAEALRRRRWSPCPCGADHGQDQIADHTLIALVGDLAELHYLLDDADEDYTSDSDRVDPLAVLTEALGHDLPELGRDAHDPDPAGTDLGEYPPRRDTANQHPDPDVAVEWLPPDMYPVELLDLHGRTHRLRFRQRSSPAGRSLTLEETTTGTGGYTFTVLGDHAADPAALAAAVQAEASTEIGRAYLDPQHSGWDIAGDEVAGRFDIDPVAGPAGPHAVVIDGHALSWDELGAALAPFEGWRFRLFLDDAAIDHRGTSP